MGVSEDRLTAAARLKLLRLEFTAHPSSSRSTVTPSRTSTGGPPPTPANVAVIDHLVESRNEMVAYTRAIAPDAERAPVEAADVVDWVYQHTVHATSVQRMVRDAMVLRQSWEHALAMGDERPVRAAARWEACPNPTCGCWSLFYQPARRIVACVNGRCTNELGLPTVWELRQLAELVIARRNAVTAAAT
ncbi:hypothetical protein [Streptomyces himastatinicus]|nr:hypothetical protein [Streptomyces himastatinicus]